MRVLLQRVSKASVEVEGESISSIQKGYLLLVGIEKEDGEDDLEWLVKKVLAMRLFPDEDGKMNLSLRDIEGELLVVSQFTLHAFTKRGNRPSFIKAANPDLAIPLYEQFVKSLKEGWKTEKVKTGVFGADMKINIINDGPVTISLDSKNKE